MNIVNDIRDGPFDIWEGGLVKYQKKKLSTAFKPEKTVMS